MRATICAIKPNPFTNPQSVKNSMDEWERQPLRRLSPTESIAYYVLILRVGLISSFLRTVPLLVLCLYYHNLLLLPYY